MPAGPGTSPAGGGRRYRSAEPVCRLGASGPDVVTVRYVAHVRWWICIASVKSASCSVISCVPE